MKRILAFLLTAAMLAALSGCGIGGSGDRAEAIAVLDGTSTTKYALSDGTTLEPQVIYDSGDIIVAVAGITGTPEAPELILAVENGSRRAIDVSVNDVVLDGWSVQAWSDLWDLSKRSVNLGTIECWDSDWSPRTGIGTIELSMYIQESDGDYDLIAEFDCTLETSAAGRVEDYEPEGVTLYDDKGIRVVMTDLVASRYGENWVYLYIENNSGSNIEVETDDVEVNGRDAELWIWKVVRDGTRAMASESLYGYDYDYSDYDYDGYYTDYDEYYDDYGEITLTETDELTFQLEISDSDTYRQIASVEVSVTPAQFN